MSIETDSFAFGSSLYGGRPTFALTRRIDDDGKPTLTLYELLPKSRAESRNDRMKRFDKGLKVISVEDAVVDFENDPDDHSWDDWVAVKVARLSETRLNCVLELIDETFRNTEVDSEDVVKGGEASLFLSEEIGVRLAIGFLGMKPIQRVDRLRAFVRGVNQMGTEECYYWYAMCRSPANPNGKRALRVLLTGHIE
jgi:hypothetical protein